MNTDNSLYKYPRTPHLPSSASISSDDKIATAETLAYLSSGIELVVTEKMDGGNVSLYSDYFHARSLDSGTHAWDTPAKALWASLRHEIPAGWRLSGESLYARRSVSYDRLPGPFMLFSVWDENNTMLGWDEMSEWAELLDIPTVPILYRGNDFTEAVKAWGRLKNDETSEGFVLRDAGKIPYDDFQKHVVKWVRKNHVRTSSDWRHRDDFAVNTFN